MATRKNSSKTAPRRASTRVPKDFPAGTAPAGTRGVEGRALSIAREAYVLTGGVCPLYRAHIYDLLASAPGAGRRNVGALALGSAERVLPYFTRARPNDDRAERLVALARQALMTDDPATLAEARDIAGSAFHEIVCLAPPSAAAAGLAAVSALSEAAGDDPLASARASLTEGTQDDLLDPESSDAARWAAAACRFGENGDETGHFKMCAIKAEMAFWSDWLDRVEALSAGGRRGAARPGTG